jgi:predicted RNA-binding Zn ribbon-like protein
VSELCDFVNTRELESGRDELGPWLARRGVCPDGSGVEYAARLREALRALMQANSGLPAAVDDAAAVIDEAGRRAKLSVGLDAAGVPRLRPLAAGLDGLLGRLLVELATTAAAGRWRRLKACRAETCGWVFLDETRNRSRRWCSMKVCGNRAKARAYRRRSGRAQ